MVEKLTHRQLAIELEKAKKGDNEAFTKIYKATNKSQYFIAFANLHNEQMAEDVIQDLYIKLFQSLNNIENGNALIAYMNRMNYNLCMTKLNKEKTNSKVDIDELQNFLVDQKELPNETINKKSEKDLLYLSLSKLDQRLSSVLIMRYIEEMQVKDIASILNISTRSVLRYTEQGCEKMRKILNELKDKIYSLPLFSVPFIANSLRGLRDGNLPPSKQDAILSNIMNSEPVKNSLASTTSVTATATAVTASAVGGAVALKAIPALSTSFYAISGVVGVTAVAALGTRIIPPSYDINYVTDLTKYNPSYVELNVQSNGSLGLSGIELINANGEIVSRGNIENNYTVYADQNGDYTLRVVGNNNAEVSETITVTTIDKISPTVSNIYINGDDVSFAVSDNLSGVDYSNISLTSDSGENVEYWIDGNTIHYSNTYSKVVARVFDKVGNSNYVTLTVE